MNTDNDKKPTVEATRTAPTADAPLGNKAAPISPLQSISPEAVHKINPNEPIEKPATVPPATGPMSVPVRASTTDAKPAAAPPAHT